MLVERTRLERIFIDPSWMTVTRVTRAAYRQQQTMNVLVVTVSALQSFAYDFMCVCFNMTEMKCTKIHIHTRESRRSFLFDSFYPTNSQAGWTHVWPLRLEQPMFATATDVLDMTILCDSDHWTIRIVDQQIVQWGGVGYLSSLTPSPTTVVRPFSVKGDLTWSSTTPTAFPSEDGSVSCQDQRWHLWLLWIVYRKLRCFPWMPNLHDLDWQIGSK